MFTVYFSKRDVKLNRQGFEAKVKRKLAVSYIKYY